MGLVGRVGPGEGPGEVEGEFGGEVGGGGADEDFKFAGLDGPEFGGGVVEGEGAFVEL